MAAAFTFGFVLEDKDEDEFKAPLEKEVESENNLDNSAASDQMTKLPASSNSDANMIRKPFYFFETSLLQRLLTERAREEIVHEELVYGETIIRRVDVDQTSFVDNNNNDERDLVDAAEAETATTSTTSSTAATTSPQKLKLRSHHPSDLLPGVYEGGATVWEGSYDLMEYLQQNMEIMPRVQSVLELGCGHALPSIYVMQLCQPQVVLLVDYNDNVLKDVTISNLVVNFCGFASESVLENVVLGAGDWMQMSEQLLRLKSKQSATTDNDENGEAAGEEAINGNTSKISCSSSTKLPVDGQFDMILAAETLYTPQAAQETAYLIDQHLSADGTAYVSTKRYYFGVGGGTDVFGECASKYGLQVETVHVVNTGLGNVREVLRVKKRPHVTDDNCG
ncbi:histidine protein methyltransferase 1 [Mayamaea pseudoterrestris]|nr:histidine protein methyltransferase 1 [Mayamaea pseudoterrestris]